MKEKRRCCGWAQETRGERERERERERDRDGDRAVLERKRFY